MSKTTVRINLSTKPRDILSTMIEELPSAYYFFRKNYGGKQKYLKYEDELLDKALEKQESQYTDLNESISKSGNRWVTYTNVVYYPKAIYAQAFNLAFVYYETYGSCGAFFPVYPPKKKGKSKKEAKPNGVIIYTSHFFQRMSERTGKAYRSKELIKEFASTMLTTASQADEDGDVIVRFKGGYGFGVEKSRSPRVMEIRTFLTDEQLSPSQKRKCEKIDAMSELISDGMCFEDVALNTVYHTCDSYEKAAKEGLEKLKVAKKLGLDRQMLFHGYVHICFIRLLQDILHTEISTQQGAVFAAMTSDCTIDLVEKWSDMGESPFTEEQKKEFKQDFIEAMVKCAKKLKLKSVNRETITARIDEIMKDNKRIVEEYNEEA